jgi:hypothetical protein
LLQAASSPFGVASPAAQRLRLRLRLRLRKPAVPLSGEDGGEVTPSKYLMQEHAAPEPMLLVDDEAAARAPE